jgi:leucyl aminopeptidase (aminopeptidase T)
MDQLRITEVITVAKMLMEWSLAIREKEKVLVLVDTETDGIVVQALCAGAKIVGAEPTVVIIIPPKIAGQDPNPIAVRAMGAADVVICPVWPAIGHSSSVKQLLDEKRIRYLSMPGITSEQMIRGAGSANYEEVFETGQRLVSVLNKAKMINIKTTLGTDLIASIKGMPYRVGAALARNPGELACFPDGEAWGAPVEGTAEGKVVIDGSLTMFGLIREPVVYRVKNGRVIAVEGGSQAREIERLMNEIENANNIAEISIGTNPGARMTGNVSEDKKGIGRVHVALGNNLLLGGSIRSTLHLDGVILEPTVTIDNKVVVEAGKIK